MSGIPNTAPAIAEIRRTMAERAQRIQEGNAPPDASTRLWDMGRALEILVLAGRITYFEADDEQNDRLTTTAKQGI